VRVSTKQVPLTVAPLRERSTMSNRQPSPDWRKFDVCNTW